LICPAHIAHKRFPEREMRIRLKRLQYQGEAKQTGKPEDQLAIDG
jgi:hypothetical protein